MTLLELLVVLGIITLVMGLGAAAYIKSSQRMREEGAAAELEVLIRSAHNSGPSFVTIDTLPNPNNPADVPWVAIPWSYKTIGQWHFEGGNVKAGFGQEAINRGCTPCDGKVGMGISFISDKPGQGHGTGCLDLGHNPELALSEGGWLEAWIRGTVDWNGSQFIFNKAGCYSFSVEPGGYLRGQAGSDFIKVRDYQLPLRRWTKVAFAWDKHSSKILIDDALYAVGPGMSATLSRNDPLTVGDDNASLLGCVDEVKIMAVFSGKTLRFPPGTKLTHNLTPWNAIFFAPDGTLDVNYHTEPAFVDLLTPESRKRRIFVSMLGSTKRGEVEKLPVPVEDEDLLTKATAPSTPKPDPRVKKSTIKVPPPPIQPDMDDDEKPKPAETKLAPPPNAPETPEGNP
jgi:hypothetical protein